MKEIMNWGKPMHTSSRIYHRGSIKLPDTKKVDIMLINLDNKYEKIGEAEFIENEVGVFADNINYLIDKEYLNQIIDESINEYLKKNINAKVYGGLTFTCAGYNRDEYKEKNSVEFKFFSYQIFSRNDIRVIIRDLKLNSVL